MVPLEVREMKEKKMLKSTSSKVEDEEKAKEMEEVSVHPFEALSAEKSKPIRKNKVNSYIRFFKDNYQILSRQHPNWLAAEITTIIRLLWQREKKCHLIKLKAPKQRPMKKLSGKMFFKRFKLKEGLNKKAADMKWKRLPVEAKRMYGKMGDPHAQTTPKPTATIVTAKHNSNLYQVLSKK